MEMKFHDVMSAGVLSGDLSDRVVSIEGSFFMDEEYLVESFVVKLVSQPGGEMSF